MENDEWESALSPQSEEFGGTVSSICRERGWVVGQSLSSSIPEAYFFYAVPDYCTRI
jgi:hypothetical protein